MKIEKEMLIFSREHSNGDAYWWREDGKGYTSDILQAGKYTEQEAESIFRNSHGDNVPVPEFVALGINARRVIFTKDVEVALQQTRFGVVDGFEELEKKWLVK